MSLLDDVLALGKSLPAEVKPVASDLVDAVTGLARALEHAGVLSPQVAQDAIGVAQTAGNVAGAAVGAIDSRPTVGSTVADAAPGGADHVAPVGEPAPSSSSDPLAGLSVEELTAELARRQSDAVKVADEQKSTLGPVEPVSTSPVGSPPPPGPSRSGDAA